MEKGVPQRHGFEPSGISELPASVCRYAVEPTKSCGVDRMKVGHFRNVNEGFYFGTP